VSGVSTSADMKAAEELLETLYELIVEKKLRGRTNLVKIVRLS
jgi:hypothetical protein